MLLELLDPAVGRASPARAFERERLGDDSDGENSPVASGLGDDRSGAGAGASAHPGGEEAHVCAFERFFDVLERFLGRGAPDFGARSGAETLGDLEPELDSAVCRRGVERLSVGVGDDEVDPLDVGPDHVGNGIAARATHSDDADPRPKFVDFRPDEIDAHWTHPQISQRFEPTM